jgi:hypothetical protein
MDNNKFFSCVGIVLLGLLAIAISAVVSGFVFMILWGWFAVPIFGLPALTIPQALGVSTLISLATYRDNPNKGETKGFAESLFGSIIISLVFLAYGWVITLFL